MVNKLRAAIVKACEILLNIHMISLISTNLGLFDETFIDPACFGPRLRRTSLDRGEG